MKQLSPTKLRQFVTYYDQKLSYREISSKTSISIASISRLTSRIVELNQAPRDLLSLGDGELHSTFYPRPTSQFQDPDWQQIHKKLQKRGVTLQLLYEQFKDSASDPVYSYSSFSRGYARWKAENGVLRSSGNIERSPGERLEVDFAGDRIQWVDRNGTLHDAKLYVASLPYSCLIFAEAFNDETQLNWIYGIVDALEYIGGVPQLLVMDNAKALVRNSGWFEGEIQYVIRSVCSYYGMDPVACQPRAPKQKNRVEAAVYDVERWLIAQLNLDHPALAADLDDLNEQIRKRIDQINDKPFKGRGRSGSRRSCFADEEQALLQILPTMPFEIGTWKLLVVDKAHCIRLASDAGHRYSTPVDYVGKKVVVQVLRTSLEIFDPETMRSIGRHRRYTNARGNKTHILPEHLTSAEKYYRRTLQDWQNLFIKKGLPSALAEEFVAYLKDKKKNFPSGRLCGAVYSLFRTFAPTVVRQAIAIALEDDHVNHKYIRNLCKSIDFAAKTNRSLNFGEPSAEQPIIHENIRNNYE